MNPTLPKTTVKMYDPKRNAPDIHSNVTLYLGRE
jgi:hypothetical protein